MEYDKVVTMAGIYIHIPFCRQKCNYCNFFSLATTRFRDEFFRALLKEIELTRDYLGDEPVETIYFGGGTPSLFPEDQVGKILDAIGDVHLTPELQLPPNPLKGAYSASREDLTPNPSPQGEGSIRHPASGIRHPAIEITLELNPEDVTPEYLEELAAAGINRYSLGVQSFFDEDLEYLSRSHDAKQAERAVEMIRDTRYGMRDEGGRRRDEGREEKFVIRKSEIVNLSIDLIFGIPTLSNEHWKENLQRVIDLGIPHLSAYALTVEPKTALAWQIEKGAGHRAKGEGHRAQGTGHRAQGTGHRAQSAGHSKQSSGIKASRLPGFRLPVSDDQSAEQFKILMDTMEQAGYIQYEISNFCLPGYESRHNSNYWKGVPYLGLGPSAHSYNGTSRSWNISNLTSYIRDLCPTPGPPNTRGGLSPEGEAGNHTLSHHVVVANEMKQRHPGTGDLLYEEEQLTPTQQYNEYVMTSLRTIQGVDLREIGRRFGKEFEEYFRRQASAKASACKHSSDNQAPGDLVSVNLQEHDGIYTLTRKGKFLADGIAADLFMVE